MSTLSRALSRIHWTDVSSVLCLIAFFFVAYVALLPDVPPHLPRVKP